jgi:hypothetical protein
LYISTHRQSFRFANSVDNAQIYETVDVHDDLFPELQAKIKYFRTSFLPLIICGTFFTVPQEFCCHATKLENSPRKLLRLL